MLEIIISFLRESSLLNIFLIFIVENLFILIMAVIIGQAAIKIFSKRKLSEIQVVSTQKEILLAFCTVILNSIVTLIGLVLWRNGYIIFTNETGFLALFDTISLLLIMDLAMYVFHRIAHNQYIFNLIHKLHHKYKVPVPLTLFILSPSEAIGFGFLWLFLLYIHNWSWLGMSLYLVLNVAFGTIGHLGVEPFPDIWTKLPVLKYISTSTFHFQHHLERDYNYGFYTTIWDKMFRTLKPDYEKDFMK